MRHHLRRSRRRLFSVNAWKVRLVFWAGALLVGGTAALFAVAAARADHLSHHFLSLHPLLPFVVIPLGFTGIAWLTRRVFPGSQGSGIPQAIAALSMRGK